MLAKLLIFILIIITVTSLTLCDPFAIRVFYGDILQDPSSTSKASIYFNTNELCFDSYISVLTKSRMKKNPCLTQTVQTSQQSGGFIVYIHKCEINSINFDEVFYYSVYGWNKNTEKNPSMSVEGWIQILLTDPSSKNKDIRAIVLADWGKVQINVDSIAPIANDLNRVLFDKNINAIIIAGDIAYDLNLQNGTIYDKFMKMISEFAARTPIIITPGNHQHRSLDSYKLLSSSFKLYGLEGRLATTIYLGSINLISFDPYSVVYGSIEQVSSLTALKNQLKKSKDNGRFVIPVSHYPLLCSSQYDRCKSNLVKLQSYFDAMLEYGVSFYIGAHTHSYERNYPYRADHTFTKQQPPYRTDGQYLISIVEGVAGSDGEIITEMIEQKPFTACYTVNQTGFGILQTNVEFMSYSHLSTKQGFMDEFKIYRKYKQIERLSNLQTVL